MEDIALSIGKYLSSSIPITLKHLQKSIHTGIPGILWNIKFNVTSFFYLIIPIQTKFKQGLLINPSKASEVFSSNKQLSSSTIDNLVLFWTYCLNNHLVCNIDIIWFNPASELSQKLLLHLHFYFSNETLPITEHPISPARKRPTSNSCRILGKNKQHMEVGPQRVKTTLPKPCPRQHSVLHSAECNQEKCHV